MSRVKQEAFLLAFIVLFVWLLGLYQVNVGSFGSLKETMTWNRAYGTIVSSETFKSHVSTRRKGRTTVRPTLVTHSIYEFSVDGSRYEGKQSYGRVGEKVEVLYDRNDPNQNKPAHSVGYVLRDCAFAICFDLFSVLGAVLLVKKLFKPKSG